MYVQFHGMTMTCMHVLKLLDVENLTNKNRGTYYGEVNDWKPCKQSKLGVHLLYNLGIPVLKVTPTRTNAIH